MKPIACTGVGLMLFLAVAGLPVKAQDQAPSTSQKTTSGSSLGDYARQIRKDPGAKATPKVFDNDNLPKEDKLSVIGQKPAEAGEDSTQNQTPDEAKTAAAKPGSTSAPTPEDAAKQAAEKQWEDKITAQKDQIDLLGRELDVLQREYQLRAAAMYADAGNRLRNEASWDKQDAQYKQQIADKQKALDDEKQKFDDLQEEARKAGVPASVREP